MSNNDCLRAHQSSKAPESVFKVAMHGIWLSFAWDVTRLHSILKLVKLTGFAWPAVSQKICTPAGRPPKCQAPPPWLPWPP